MRNGNFLKMRVSEIHVNQRHFCSFKCYRSVSSFHHNLVRFCMIGEKKLPAKLLPLFLPHFLWRSMAHVMCPFPLLKIKIDAEFVGVMLHMFSLRIAF